MADAVRPDAGLLPMAVKLMRLSGTHAGQEPKI